MRVWLLFLALAVTGCSTVERSSASGFIDDPDYATVFRNITSAAVDAGFTITSRRRPTPARLQRPACGERSPVQQEPGDRYHPGQGQPAALRCRSPAPCSASGRQRGGYRQCQIHHTGIL